MDNNVYIAELLKLTLYLGTFTYCTGTVLFLILLHRWGFSYKWSIYWLYVFCQLSITYGLTLLIFLCWFIDVDIMFGPLLLPACLAELISFLLLSVYIKMRYK